MKNVNKTTQVRKIVEAVLVNSYHYNDKLKSGRKLKWQHYDQVSELRAYCQIASALRKAKIKVTFIGFISTTYGMGNNQGRTFVIKYT